MLNIECQFSNPVMWNGLPPENQGVPWNFKSLNCTSTDTTQILIKNEASSTEFYLNKTFNYGDLFIIFFLFCFCVYILTNFLIDWFIPKKFIWRK